MAKEHGFSARSLSNLVGVHPDLIRVVGRGMNLYPHDMTVIEGLRTLARQKELVAKGASQTLNSRHLKGFAVDLLPIDPSTGKGTYDWKFYHPLGDAIKAAAKELDIEVDWGGDWKSFKDGPHFELRRSVYPDSLTFNSPDAVEVSRLLSSVREGAPAPEPAVIVAPAVTPIVTVLVKDRVFKAGTYTAVFDLAGNLTVTEK